jgi:hypothetical protein
MAILSMLDSPVAGVLCCMIVPAVSILLIIKATRKTASPTTSPQMANPHSPSSNGPADHQVSRNGTVLGTHNEADLRNLLASGKYHPTDYYWKPGMPTWAPLSTLLAQASGVVVPGIPPSHPGQRIAIRGTVISFSIQNGSGMISGLN